MVFVDEHESTAISDLNQADSNHTTDAAFMKARKELKLEGFVPCGGKTAKGKAFLATTRKFYKA